MNDNSFDLRAFMPYLLNQAAEVLSLEFQQFYKARYGMLRTEWRVLFHLGRYGEMTAKDVCERARLHKTKVSRAVAALENKRFVTRMAQNDDRRRQTLTLTHTGQKAFKDLRDAAQAFDLKVQSKLSEEEVRVLRTCLTRIAGF